MTLRFDLIRKNILAMVALGALVLGAVLLVWSPARAQPSGSSSPFGKAQLEQLVAPIALYPDDLMSQVLMASTYPLEVVEVARWSRDNESVSGKALEDAMIKQSWDPSVKALAAVPQTLEMMNDKLTWTQQLGGAFLAQQQDVLDAVQRLRQRAEEAGNLKTTPQQVVRKTSTSTTTTGSASAEPAVFAIAPTDPEMLYVPVYDPGVIYGDWPYADYQPFYWYPSGFVAGNVLSFATGVAVGAAIWGNVDWRRRNVNINVDRYNQFNHTLIASNDWNHNPVHSGAVPFRDRNVADKFGGAQEAAAHQPGGPQRATPAQRDKQVGQKPHRKPVAQKRTGNSAVARPSNLNRPNVAAGAT